jgi:hypothetical protein
MDLFIYTLSLIIVMITLGNAENISAKGIAANFIIAATLLVITLFLTSHFSRTTSEEMHDVAIYSNTTFAEPKTILVETTFYPWWSIYGAHTEWHVQDQK